MSLTDLLVEFRDLEASADVAKSYWYIVAASALAAAGAGSDTIELYRLATEGLTLKLEKLVQRRIKEAILKTSCLYGVPKSLQALLPLWDSLPDSHIDHYGPRFEAAANKSRESEEAREARGQKYFDTLWGREAAQFHRDRNFKYQPDLYLLNLKMIYEWHFSEDSILGAVETQMSNISALICSNCPTQVTWHTRGLIRHGGSFGQAEFSRNVGLKIAAHYGCKTGTIMRVEEMDLNTESPH